MALQQSRPLCSAGLRQISASLRRRKFGAVHLLPEIFCRRSFDLLQEGAALLDAQGNICLANQALTRILDHSGGEKPAGLEIFGLAMGSPDSTSLADSPSQDLTGMSITRFIPKEFSENFMSMIDLLDYGDGFAGPFELVLVRPDGKQLQVQSMLRRMDYNGQKYTMLLAQDVTEWKEVRTTLEVANFELEQSYSATLEVLAHMLELRDLETFGHADRVKKMTIELALRIGMSVDEMVHIRHGALMHDIGKIYVPDSILKKPGKLTEEEWVSMRKHPTYARELMEKIEYLRPAVSIPYGHHEWWNGEGYPQNLIGQQIPLPARMFAVIDVYDALSHPRCYRPEVWSHDRIMNYLWENAEKQFDPDVLRVFSSYM
jgi:HD-GYP domain-containing protein (c-di-GMP phosphodiesterase class II)